MAPLLRCKRGPRHRVDEIDVVERGRRAEVRAVAEERRDLVGGQGDGGAGVDAADVAAGVDGAHVVVFEVHATGWVGGAVKVACQQPRGVGRDRRG